MSAKGSSQAEGTNDRDGAAESEVGDGAAIIAATSMIVEEPVLTRNAADFERRGVEVETY